VDTSQTPHPPTRRYPRLELKAVVLLDRSGMALHLPVRNVSRGGVLVGAVGNDLSSFQLGSTHHLTIIDAEELNAHSASVDARVVRHDAIGMALSWDDSDISVDLVGGFLDAFYSKR
jgi:hypothetical protein